MTTDYASFETVAGTFYARPLSAERRTYYSGGEYVEEIQPRVWLATDPEFKADTDLGHLKIRGRKYAIANVMKLSDVWTGERMEKRWQSEASYGGGFRNDKGQKVGYDTKAYDALRQAELDAIELYAVTFPEWERESARLLFERERDHHLSKKRNLLQDANREDVEAARWQKRLDDLLAA
ncbi:hypothetical protein [Streptomyces werraensis]|uniref:hypothetical protein n=1 Tax=Streptomyces werraensis TaxID=68284 RepID=UPI003438BEB5